MATTQINTHKNFIGGQWQESVSGRTYQVYNPARKTESVGEFQTSNLEDTATAVAAAKEVAAGWANTLPVKGVECSATPLRRNCPIPSPTP